VSGATATVKRGQRKRIRTGVALTLFAASVAVALGGTAAFAINTIGGVTVAPSTSSAEITWTASSDPSLDHYDVSVGSNVVCANVPAGTQTCTDSSGLAADTSYTATVVAKDSGGTTLESGTSAAFEVGAPTEPLNVTTTANADGSITITWQPSADPHAGVAHYTATLTPGNITCVTPDGATTTCTVPANQVTRGTSYGTTVVANGVVNTGEATNDSGASNPPLSVASVLDVPTAVTATSATDGSITVGWSLPTDQTGIDHYTATTSPTGGTCSSAAATPSATSCVITTGLTNGVVYTVSVKSVASGGAESVASGASLPAVVGPLAAPTNVLAVANVGTAWVWWTAPAGVPSGSIAYYSVAGSPAGVCNTPDASVTGCWVTGITNFASTTFTVTAHATAASHLTDSVASAASNSVVAIPSAITMTANANGKFVSAGANGTLIASASAAGNAEKFDVQMNADGTISLKDRATGGYVSAERGGAAPLIANRGSVGSWERFRLVDAGGGMLAIRAAVNGRFVSADSGGAAPLIANRTAVSTWEKFTVAATS
jgi:hypothetical protein